MSQKIVVIFSIVLLILVSISCVASSSIDSNEITDDNTITLYSEVNLVSAYKIIARIQELQKFSNTKPIYFFIDSPGGEVFSGTKIIDAMLASHRPIYTIDVGTAASMAAYIHSYGVQRMMLPHAVIMFHNASVSYDKDSAPFIESRLRMVNSMMLDLDNNVSNRTGVPLTELKIKEGQEWWILSGEALKRHFVDKVINTTDYPVPVEK